MVPRRDSSIRPVMITKNSRRPTKCRASTQAARYARRGHAAAPASYVAGGICPMAADAARAATGSRRLVLLISAALFINYVDRGNLATAAPLFQDQLHLSATQLGTLLSAFYYSYVLAMVPVGWLAERLGAHRVLGAGVALWAASTLLTGFAGGFVSLLLLRLLLGL